VSNNPPPVPAAADVFGHAVGEIRAAAAELWPGAEIRLGQQVPSVTGYVHRLAVDDRELYAKYSFLGVSLVSLLRGACGPWPNVLDSQRKYVERRDGLLAREAAQLSHLASVGRPQVCTVEGLARGVLLTRPVAGPTLADLMLADGADVAALLGLAYAELHRLHHPPTSGRLGPAAVIGERSIAGTFLRKFNGISGATYVGRLGAERCAATDRQEVVAELRAAVAILHRLRIMTLPTGRPTLVYGDMKPEHVVFPDGLGGTPVFLDPGLLRAGASVDAAKLASRTVLLLAAARPSQDTGKRVAVGLGSFVEDVLRGRSRQARTRWLRELLTLWLMDTTNIMTTYLSAPAALPLPRVGQQLVRRAVPVCRNLRRQADELAHSGDVLTVWERALVAAEAVAA
jgi:hypothetical protein